ncbi:Wzz/FepE/Etk N-terminal domain-containing protein [Aeromonas hydrophila]|uniref:LPS O-antigen chain length determinant protein WzzB n=1 Tax=Aeromonas hydrophila TaxID=644 RepID=UPI00208E66FA|nr:Wzz/FepE/Etk N-terminal domain-containing protein [Aeromonas hydrophila]MCO4198581.1 Wzz/FepE/Etk N-terminal domain-containing protein [Aeromonas hydrophila]
MNKETPQMPTQWTNLGADEIDLRELVSVLWCKRVLILALTSIFAIIGIIYALYAQQIWSANAVINTPTTKDVQPMLRVINRARLLGLTEFPNSAALYEEFVREFNSYENRREFLRSSDLFKRQVVSNQLDERSQRRWLRDWAKLMLAEPVDKKGEGSEVLLTTSADNSLEALSMLEQYIKLIVYKQNQRVLSDLVEQKESKVEELQSRLSMAKSDAEINLKNEIKSLTLAISVAKAAGVEHPLENYSNNERFPITLGVKGLEQKLRLLKGIELAVYQPALVELQTKINRLKEINLTGLSFRPFSYTDVPEEPLNRDKPKRPLIVVLATLLGCLFGVGVVLGHHVFRRPLQS